MIGKFNNHYLVSYFFFFLSNNREMRIDFYYYTTGMALVGSRFALGGAKVLEHLNCLRVVLVSEKFYSIASAPPRKIKMVSIKESAREKYLFFHSLWAIFFLLKIQATTVHVKVRKSLINWQKVLTGGK